MTSHKPAGPHNALGFFDEDLATPKHDAILLWLHANMGTVVSSLIPSQLDWDAADGHFAETWAPGQALPSYPGFDLRVEAIYWQMPLYKRTSHGSANSSIIGFADMVAVYSVPELCVPQNRKLAVGRSRHSVFFEVKSEIPSVGELIREVNVCKRGVLKTPDYQSGAHRFAVVCPQAGLTGILRSQDILYVQCPPVE